MSIERLNCRDAVSYQPLEAAIHVGRYAPVLPHCSGRRVLDVACGEGYGASLLKSAGALHVEGFDNSVEAIEAARTLFAADGLNFRAGDACHLEKSFEPNSFDLVCSIETIEHLADPVAFLRGLKAVAKEDAVIYLTCPNDHVYYPAEESNPFHLRKYSFAEFRAMAEAELGGEVTWYYGAGVLGFASLPLAESDGKAPTPYSDARPMDRMMSVAADPVAPDAASYYVGIWNGKFTGGAVFPVAMGEFINHVNAPVLRAENSRLKQENHVLAAGNDFMVKENESLALKSEKFEQELARLSTIENDCTIWRVQAVSLRREVEIISGILHSERVAGEGLRQQLGETQALNQVLQDEVSARLQEIERVMSPFLMQGGEGCQQMEPALEFNEAREAEIAPRLREIERLRAPALVREADELRQKTNELRQQLEEALQQNEIGRIQFNDAQARNQLLEAENKNYLREIKRIQSPARWLFSLWHKMMRG